MEKETFEDRRHAGRNLAENLQKYRDEPAVIVLGLARGGVPVAYEVAEQLDVPLDVLVVRKLGVPGQRELAMGAIGPGRVRVLNEDLIERLGIRRPALEEAAREEEILLEERMKKYRGDRGLPNLKGSTVILVDDGLATGASMRAAVEVVLAHQPAKVVAAVPVGSRQTCEAMQEYADEVICALTPEPFYGVGQFYEDFGQTTDAEVQRLVAMANPVEEERNAS